MYNGENVRYPCANGAGVFFLPYILCIAYYFHKTTSIKKAHPFIVYYLPFMCVFVPFINIV